MSSNGKLHPGEMVESRVTNKSKEYPLLPGDALKVLEVGYADDGAPMIVVEPIHLTGTRLTLPLSAVKKSSLPNNYLDLDETDRARLGGLGDLNNVPEDIVESLENLPDTKDIEYE